MFQGDWRLDLLVVLGCSMLFPPNNLFAYPPGGSDGRGLVDRSPAFHPPPRAAISTCIRTWRVKFVITQTPWLTHRINQESSWTRNQSINELNYLLVTRNHDQLSKSAALAIRLVPKKWGRKSCFDRKNQGRNHTIDHDCKIFNSMFPVTHFHKTIIQQLADQPQVSQSPTAVATKHPGWCWSNGQVAGA